MFVKICGLRDEHHVQVAVDAGADAVGFVFAASPRRIAPREARNIARSVPPSIRRVAVMLHPTNEEWQAVLADFQPDVLQTDAADFDALEVPEGIERWPVYREGSITPESGGTFVYEGRQSGQGETVDWSLAARFAAEGDMILAGGLAAANVATAIATARPFGVDVSSAVEVARGQKDERMIRDFIKAAKAAENEV